VLDLDGNGTLDLVTLRNGRQYRACQSAPRQLTPSDRALPLPPDRLKLFDPAFDMQCDDVDGDGRADLLLATSTRRDDDVEARVDLFLAREDGSWPDEPTSRLRLQPLAGPPRLVDVDGDGRRDLVCVSLRTSSMRDFTGETAIALDAQLSLFRNDGAGFKTPALLTKALSLAAGDQRLSPPFLVVRPARRGASADVLLHVDGHVERRPLVPSGDSLRLGSATARTAVPENARVVATDAVAERDGEHDDVEVLIVTDGEVRHARFAR
jgi:hypothetical protein